MFTTLLLFTFLLQSQPGESLSSAADRTLYLQAMYHLPLPHMLNTATTVNPEQPDSWLGVDKLWHFSFSFLLTGASYYWFQERLDQDRSLSSALACSLTLGCGLGKELFDLRQYGLFSYKDLLFDMAGIAVGYLVFIF